MRIIYVTFIVLMASQFTGVQAANKQAAVAMPDQYSAEVAQHVLASGGHAVDATVAAAFVLAVTYPEAGNLGGGGFMTLVDKSLPYFLDYREKAPQKAHRELYLDAKKQPIPYRSLIGHQASGVPGTVMGMWQAHQKFGRLPWADLLRPAINLAEKGFKIPADLVKKANWYQSYLSKKSDKPLNFKRYFGGLKSGELFVQSELADTLKRIAKSGPFDFYFGKTAELILAEMQAHNGLISKQDLTRYEAKWRQPIVATWRGRQVISAPPPSSGGVALVQLLKMSQILQNDFQEAVINGEKADFPEAAIRAHFYAELSKRVYADRSEYLGDPDFVKVPVSILTSDAYSLKRVESVSLETISETEDIRPGLAESHDTTHFSIVDGDGNAVSNTYTLNMPFGNGVVVTGAGFLMNNEMDDFSTKPGVPNLFGVIGGEANEIAPEKRMLSSMSPSVVMKDQQVEIVVGTPGGSSIITSVFQTLVNLVERDMSPQQAVDATRVHHQLWPKNLIQYNPELEASTKDALTIMGYQLKRSSYLGDVQLITKQYGLLQAASDSRGRGVARVFEVSK
ncbi:gamma-glutamyltransferase [Hydrogenovibrio sp. SC-1]|uniref:gamma-glutamyltransferase n=1 Tax=Hydrogenovibrio sp. SC-1 TaxID=2065820 RepID=UPI000C7C0181|nr:gamma-glutamyltransferase [Hydrogenovibrio sp. SC-1]PLA74118.1 gamma-glutamyltransferase [Hydrogenovibrio sp. SC-1]